MEKKQKSHIRPIVYVMISVFLIIGYAYLTSSLTINGASLLKKATWDVHFENVQVKDGSVTGDQVIDEPEIDSEQTTVTFHVNLKKPGDYYEFTVDAVNAGTIDAMINSYTEFDLTEDQLKYLETSVTYEDGEEIAEKQQLLAGDFAVYKIVVSFKKDLEASDLPSNPEQLDLEFTVEYVQKDDSAIERRAETNSLYNVLKREAESGGLALKYTGEHQDSMDESKSTRDIYHWYSTNDTRSLLIQDKWNVIFANHCWWMIRTTDTGGVKMMYNGEVEEGKCLDSRSMHVGYSSESSKNLSGTYYYGTSYTYDSSNNLFSLDGTIMTGAIYIGQYTCMSTLPNGTCSTLLLVSSLKNGTTYNVLSLDSNSHYSQFGTLKYNRSSASPSDVGYMYNTRYEYNRVFPEIKKLFEEISFNKSSTYTFGSNIVYDTSTGNYSLTDTMLDTWENIYSSSSGLYTCKSSLTECSNVYYISTGTINDAYGFELSNGYLLEYYNDNVSFGTGYTENNGVFMLQNVSTFSKNEWVNNYSTYKGYYTCDNGSTSCSSLKKIVTTGSYYYYSISSSKDYVYASDFIYDYNSNTYHLGNDTVQLWDLSNSSNINSVNTHQYTCFNDSGECDTLFYVFGIKTPQTSNAYMYYVELKDGTSIEDAVNEMFYNDDVNTNNSLLKTGFDYWYERYLVNYSNYLEDIIFCNDRNNFTGYSFFSRLNNISCMNITDCFSTSNNKALLNYPVGLMNYNEMNLLNRYTVRKTGKDYWLGTADRYSDNGFAYVYAICSEGQGCSTSVNTYAKGVRPAISLKPGTMFSSGDGSMSNPYVIDTN